MTWKTGNTVAAILEARIVWIPWLYLMAIATILGGM